MITVNNFSKKAVDKKFRNEISLEKFLKKVAKIVLKGENVKIKDVSIVLVEAQEIRKLNNKYRRKDKATDVLSFNYGNVGEVVLCPEVINKFVLSTETAKIRKNAEKFKNPYKKEIIRILIHGVLHLAGYDHEKSKKEAEKMAKKENLYLKLVD